jgi:hypothetical protein
MSMLPPAFKVSADQQLPKTWHLRIGGPFGSATCTRDHAHAMATGVMMD